MKRTMNVEGAKKIRQVYLPLWERDVMVVICMLLADLFEPKFVAMLRELWNFSE